jgi:hypothetical protein
MCNEWLIGGLFFLAGKKAKVRGGRGRRKKRRRGKKKRSRCRGRRTKEGGEIIIAFVAT